MPCFGSSKKIDVVDSIVEPSDDAALGKRASSATKNRFSSGTSPSSARDGLSSAPTSQDKSNGQSRAGLHSAPSNKSGKKSGKGNKVNPSVTSSEPLSEFIIEADGKDNHGKDNNTAPPQPDAAAVDAYLEAIIGSKIVKDLRAGEWATRVGAIEALQQQVKRRSTEAAVATGSGEAVEGSSERASLFRACVTVLARVLQDKVVPVFLPALALLAEVYAPSFLEPIQTTTLPKNAIPFFAHNLVFRAGSSNQRASSESSAALLALARTDAVGCAAIGPHALGRLSNSKSAHAAVGRLDLLKALVSEFGVGVACGLELREVLVFTLPLCEHANEKCRDVAMGIVLDVRAIHPVQTDRLIDEVRPSVAALIKMKLSTPITSLSVSGKRMLAPLAPIGGGGGGGGGMPGAMPGAMPTTTGGNEAEEVLAVHDGNNAASATAAAVRPRRPRRASMEDIGNVPAPPPPLLAPKKGKSPSRSPGLNKSPHGGKGKYNVPSVLEEDAMEDALAEATFVLNDEGLVKQPAPGREQARSPALAPRMAQASMVDLTEEQMMDQILCTP